MNKVSTTAPVGTQVQLLTPNRATIDGTVEADGGGATLVNLPNTVWVAQGTTVAVPDQTGNIEAPFSTLAAARTALLALGNALPKLMVVMPGDYSAEAALVWDSTGPDGTLNIVNGSWLPMQLNQSIQNVTMPALTLAGLMFLTGLILGNITGTATLELTSCQKLSGTIAADRTHATNSYLNCSMDFGQTGSIFRDCTTGAIETPGDDGPSITFIDTNIIGNITFNDPGIALIDGVSWQYMLNNGAVFVLGMGRNADAQSMILYFGGEDGAHAIGDFNRPWQPLGTPAATEFTVATIRLERPGVLMNMRAAFVNAATTTGAATLTAHLDNADSALSVTIANGASRGESLSTAVAITAGGHDLSVRATSNFTAGGTFWVTIEYLFLPG